MKNLYIILLTAFVLSSCDIANFDEDINQNPNLPTEASGTQLIANAQLSLSSLGSTPQGEFMGQYLAETQYVNASLYPEGGTSFYWLYQGPLMNLESVLNSEDELSGTEGPINNQIAVAKILKAYYFWHMTDRWGDIPYSEAFQGADNFTPAYDTQEDIYHSLFSLLDEADNQIVNANISNDIIYGGDMAKWQKLGNTIRMLMALRLSEVDETTAQEQFTQALDAGVMESNEDNFYFPHLADANNQSYWYSEIEVGGREWWALTEGLVDLMAPNNDPRLNVYADEARESGDFVGLPYGTPADEAGTEAFSLIGEDIRAQDAPVYLVTHAQAMFARAEAAQRGWSTEDAETSYNEAVTASIEQWTGSEEGAEEYLVQQPYDANAPIEQIATQRYLHLFMHGYEAWAEWRRTGFPDNMVNPNERDVPLRQSYTSDEALNNTEHYNEAVQRQFDGEDTIYGRLWWDVQ